MKTITTILNISVLGFGICKFDLSDRLSNKEMGWTVRSYGVER